MDEEKNKKCKNEKRVFCDNIKYLREKTKLTKSEMASRLHISEEMLTCLEQGELPDTLDCDVLFYIQKNFGIPPVWMFSRWQDE